MPNLTDATSYADAQRLWSSAAAWELFDGDRAWFNIGHECVDRHVGQGRTAIRLAHADGRDEALTFEELAAASSRVAHWLEARGRSEEHTSELQSLMRISYAVFCLKKKNKNTA